jgi:uncharacterized membrane-anchored protein
VISGTRLIAALIVALAQIGFLGWIIAGRAAVLRDGREITLKVEPVDPRDLLRGDYVRLGYGTISSLPTNQITNIGPDQFSSADSWLYVRLRKGTDGYWQLVSATFDAPLATAPGPDEVDIRGHVDEGWNLGANTSIGVNYGLERFYLPEGEGLELEKDMRIRPLGVRAAVGSDGTAQIKALLDGDRPLYEEPFY